MEDLLQKLHEFNDNLSDVTATLSKYEDKVRAHRDLGALGKDAKHLDKMRVSVWCSAIFNHFLPRTLSQNFVLPSMK